MTEDQSEQPSRPDSPREQAKKLCTLLDELVDRVDEAREVSEKGKPPPERVMALIADTHSLAMGISSGLLNSQPRMATNLVECASILDDCDHYRLACSFTNLLRWLSTNGLAAENCIFGRSRGGPAKG